ncbi:hypothetical protein ABE425_05480 [Chryseobacterium cucumeris]|uniref:hypothetical protein n=1 Tax=Chryseobacterium cucumeris TaxID=1813611 RepID=UPI00320B4C99
MNTVITIEDKGQDFTKIVCDSKGVIIETLPFQSDIWKNGIIPINDKDMMKIGQPCPLHKPPHFIYGFLNYNIVKVENDKSNT